MLQLIGSMLCLCCWLLALGEEDCCFKLLSIFSINECICTIILSAKQTSFDTTELLNNISEPVD